jgi:MobA-like NTP transferase domain
MHRIVAVLVTPAVSAAAPPGVDPVAFGRALVEDSCDLAAGLELVTPAVAVSESARRHLGSVRELVWPGTPVLELTAHGEGLVGQTLRALGARGADQAVVLAADAPDLPPLLVGKLLRALGAARRADFAVCPAEGGGLVGLAAWLPVAGWFAAAASELDLPDSSAELDVSDFTTRLRGAAPRRGLVQSVPGWHRLRSAGDLERLDPGLEGWQATRGVLRSGR